MPLPARRATFRRLEAHEQCAGIRHDCRPGAKQLPIFLFPWIFVQRLRHVSAYSRSTVDRAHHIADRDKRMGRRRNVGTSNDDEWRLELRIFDMLAEEFVNLEPGAIGRLGVECLASLAIHEARFRRFKF